MIRKSLFSGFAVLLLAAYASAGPVYMSLVIDPGTTAGGGSTSTRSGAGTWHLYALDTENASLGLATYSATLSNITQILNRSPVTDWDTADPDTGPFKAGFNLLRSANDTAPPVAASSNPVNGSQDLPGSQPIIITGFGREASTFAAKLPAGATLAATTSGSWGSNTTDPNNQPGANLLPWLFLAEGNWLGGANPIPTITAGRVQVLTAVNNEAGTYSVAEATECFNCAVPVAPQTIPVTIANDLNFPNIDTTVTPVVNGVMGTTPANASVPITWTLGGVTFTPSNGATQAAGLAAAASASLTPSGDTRSATFNWGTVGAPLGTYVWAPTADNADPAAADAASITVNITAVPEPATFALVGLALVGLAGIRRRS